MTDCAAASACDLADHECVANFKTTLGDDGGARCEVSFAKDTCGFSAAGPYCRLPQLPRTTLPCCFERSDAGQPVSCLEAMTCFRPVAGGPALEGIASGVCPL